LPGCNQIPAEPAQSESETLCTEIRNFLILFRIRDNYPSMKRCIT